jgi:ribosomal protein S18 acetylase RimI-like enzyme
MPYTRFVTDRVARPFLYAEDVPRLQDFTAECIRAVGFRSYMHPGDVAHRIAGGLKNEVRGETVRVWEDELGIAAWVLVSPNHQGFDLQVRPDLRSSVVGGVEREALTWAEARTVELLTERGSAATEMIADAFEDDEVRIALLEDTGWQRGTEPYVITLRSLDVIPEEAAVGYTVRAVKGPEEADAVGELHAASFGSSWLPGQYARYMSAPGYAPERELVATSAAGDLCGFTVTWHDHVNGIGLFEPVGVHPDHRRKGLGRLLLAEGMHRMRAAGLTHGMVAYEGSNPASGALYRGIGFAPTWTMWDYTKPIG